MSEKTIAFRKERAYCPFYAADSGLGLVAASALTTARELGLRIAARLVGGQAVPLADGTILKRQKDVEIPLPASEDDDSPTMRYKASYTRNHPHPLETDVGYETCVLHRDATMHASPDHWGYLLRLPGEDDDEFQRRFLHLWGRVTELPARPSWSEALWSMGLKLELIAPLSTFGCQGWRIDPRWDRPDGMAGWREVLETLVLVKEEV